MSWRIFIAVFPIAIFHAVGAFAPLIAEEVTKSDGSNIGIVIMGSIIQKDGQGNVALIKEESGSVKAVKVDHVIMNKFKVINVTAQYIEVVTRDSKRYLIYQDKFAGNFSPRHSQAPTLVGHDGFKEDGFERTKDKIVMTAMYRDKLVQQDLAKVLMQATAEPYLENGNIAGFKMSQIDENSIYQKAGLRDGDIVTGINGTELNSVAGSITLLKSLKTADNLEVEIRREGVPMKFTISVN